MNLRTKTMLLVIPLILALAVLSVMGMVSTRNMAFRLSDITGFKIPLTSLVSRVSENQLEQALWFERAMVFAERADGQSFAESLREFQRLGVSITGDLNRARELAAGSPAGTGGPASSRELERVGELLAGIASRRERYEQAAREILGPLQRGLPGEVDKAQLDGTQSLESALYEDIEALREELTVYAQNAAGEVLVIERRVHVFMIVGASLVVLLGLIAFPLLLLFWDVDRQSLRGEVPPEHSIDIPEAVGPRKASRTSRARG